MALHLGRLGRTSEMLALFGNSPNCVSMDTHFGDACLIWQLAQLRVRVNKRIHVRYTFLFW